MDFKSCARCGGGFEEKEKIVNSGKLRPIL